MSYKVLIINNEDNSVVLDEDNAVAIVGAINNGETTSVNAHTDSNLVDIACAIQGAQQAANVLISRHPELKLLLALLSAETKE